MDRNAENSLTLREIILNARKPIVLKNFQHKWKCFPNDLSEWCELLDKCNEKKKTFFERMLTSDANEPQWERKRQLVQLNATEFLQVHKEEQNFWSGMNYIRRHELPAQSTEGIDFGCFGFAQASDQCTFWLSSKGANTPCHYDSYGCNIVVQVFGRKSWYMFPPSAGLTPIRIPYEESSIYCKENLYAPQAEDKANLITQKAQLYHCVLEPNDVLIVPKHWWHYVEALEISLSVNAWIPLFSDVEDQIEECIVKHIIESFLKDKSTNTRDYILNPNQISDGTSDENLLAILEYLIEEKNALANAAAAKKDCSKYDYQYLDEDKLQNIIIEIGNTQEVPLITAEDFELFITSKKRRHKAPDLRVQQSENFLSHIQEELLNSMLSPNVIQIIKQEFFERYNCKKTNDATVSNSPERNS